MQEMNYCDLANFGWREINLAADLLRSYASAGQYRDGKQYNYLPESWDDVGVKLAFNPNNGSVFLTNDATDAEGTPLPPERWGGWAKDNYEDARYLLGIILTDAPADAVIRKARKILADLPDEGE